MQLYETSLRVPLLFAGKGVSSARVVREPARTLDVAPTILALFGIAPGSSMTGRDLLGAPPPRGDDLPFVAETHPAKVKSSPLYALRTEKHKVVWQPRRRRWEFYDLERDPQERNDLSGEESRLFQVLAADLELDLRNRPVGKTETIDEERGGRDQEVTDALRSLGYLD
jgi:arylsulfatase A-like enzyme